MDYLSWDLAIFSRAVAYNNLSGASSHVGLSQPQLSRIVAKLEDQLGLTLLDRETKRKSSWTPAAFKLAEIYTSTFQNFRAEVHTLVDGLEPDNLRIGCLEGLIPQATDFCHRMYAETSITVIELNVLDTSFLEEKFFKSELDLIFTSREPGRKKFRFIKKLGYQSIDDIDAGEMEVFSTFEYLSQVHKGKPKNRAFVSNSLQVRRHWIDQYGGKGTLPSELRQAKKGKANEVPVLVIAHDQLPASYWNRLATMLEA